MNNYLIVLSGIPASGKSTYGNRVSDCNYDFAIVCPDNIREELYGDANIQGDGNKVFEIAYTRLKLIGMRDGNAVFDATNCSAKRRAEFVNEMRDYYDIIVCHYFRPNLERALAQNSQRDRVVPSSVIRRMASQWEEPTTAEGFD
jgi:predicted kinase